MNDIVLRAYRDGDRAAVRALVEAVFGSSANFDRYEHGNPLGEPIRVIAEMNGAVVGFNQWNAWLVHTEHGALEVYQSGTSAVSSECRGHGVFGKILNEGERLAEQRGIRYFIGFPNPASFRSFLRAGWHHAGSLRLHLTLVPSLGSRGTDAPSLDTSSVAGRFASWRYAAADVEARGIFLRDGSTYVAFFRRMSHRGVPFLRLLDIVRASGQRDFSRLSAVATRLPGPSAIYLRTCNLVRPTAVLPIRRRWETPLIIKPIGTPNPEFQGALRRALFSYGDIDAS